MIIIAGHATLIDGKIYEAPVNTLVETLADKKSDFYYLRHSLDGRLNSMLYEYKSGRVSKERKLWTIRKISVLRYTTEILSSIFVLSLISIDKKIFYVGADPLNAFIGVMLKKIGRFKKTIFYTTDYSPKRFSNKLLDTIFKKIDQYDIKYSDAVWNVSSRIYKIREKQGLKKEKNIIVPNVPSSQYKQYLKNKKEEFSLITLGIVGEQLDYVGVFEAIVKLKKEFPKIKFKIIGNGPKLEEYKKITKTKGIEQYVDFLGYLVHDKSLEQISKSGVGLALYNGKWGFNYYGDSMKCREYLCFGLPIISTDTHSTVDDIKNFKAGEIVDVNAADYERSIRKIFSKYDSYSKNAFSLAQKFNDIHLKLLKELDDSL